MQISPIKSIHNRLYVLRLRKQLEKVQPDSFERTSKPMSEVTFNKAKEMVIKTAVAKNPRESLVVIKDDKIISYSIGSKNDVGIPKSDEKLIKKPDSNIEIIHSHILQDSKKTLPVSFSDARCIIDKKGIISVWAIAPDGSYSRLKKVSDYTLDDFYEAGLEYNKYFSRAFSNHPSEQENYNNLIERYAKYANGLDYENPDEVQLLYSILNNYIEKASGYSEAPMAVHQFWLEYAPKLGLEYTTNFTF